MDRSGKGRYYWITVVSCCGLISAAMGICYNSYGVFYSALSDSLGVGRGAVAVHATIAGIVNGIMGPLIVRLMKTVKLRVIICTGIFLICASFLLMAYTDRLWVFNLLGAVRGVGTSCYFLPVVTMILGNWFRERRGAVIGVTLSCTGVTGAVFSPLLSSFIEQYGYRAGYILVSVVVVLLSVPGGLLCRLHPRERGLEPYGATDNDKGPDDLKEPPRSEIGRIKLRFASPVFICAAVYALGAASVTSMAQHFGGFAESLGLASSVGAAMMSAAMIGNILFKFFAGFLIDRRGTYRTVTMLLILTLSALSLMTIFSSAAALLVVSFIFGASYSLGALGLASLTRDVFGDEQYGEAFSVLAALASIGNALSLTVVGAIYDLTGTYVAAIAVCLSLTVLCLLSLIAVSKLTSKHPLKPMK